MGFTPGHFVTPAAAFTMAIVVTFYVKYAISTVRAESNIRRAGELAQVKEARMHPQAQGVKGEVEKGEVDRKAS
ncbi:hypothetical protein EUX98_g859 [Antrodiella citrinella]|uniref:Uncharacterized protein n=1 Tax=Antrodiella citrinella TaxID=2447956 RepID=A0A4S4N329_9APHY|nr:hypothetical protein EUX98_g859 [Antrodiella citrinella]